MRGGKIFAAATPRFEKILLGLLSAWRAADAVKAEESRKVTDSFCFAELFVQRLRCDELILAASPSVLLVFLFSPVR